MKKHILALRGKMNRVALGAALLAAGVSTARADDFDPTTIITGASAKAVTALGAYGTAAVTIVGLGIAIGLGIKLGKRTWKAA